MTPSFGRTSFSVRPHQGFSLVEILLVLGVIAVLALAAFLIFPQVQSSSQADVEAKNLTAITAGVHNLYLGRVSYADVTTTVVYQASIFPKSMVGDTSRNPPSILHGGGGTVEVVPEAPANKRFKVLYHTVPTGLCQKLVTGVGRNFERVEVGAVVVKEETDTAADPALAVGECNRTNANEVAFFLR